MSFSKLFSCAIATLFMTAIGLYAVPVEDTAIVDNCESGTNQNNFGSYWYMYDDNKDGGNSVIEGFSKDAMGEYVGVVPIATQGNNGSAGYMMKYKIGDKPGGTPPATYNFIGTGCELAGKGSFADISKGKAVIFWAKADPPVQINFEVATSDVSDFGYHRKLIDVTASWTKFTVELAEGGPGIMQPSWAKAVPYNGAHVQKFQWQVHSDLKPPAAGVFNLDDVSIAGMKIIPPDVCMGCLTLPMPASKALLSDLDTIPLNGNKAGGWWYCYNDSSAHKNPPVTLASEFSEINAGIKAGIIDINGNGKTGNGASIGFQLGPTFKSADNKDVIKPFVGIGTKLCDKLGTMFYNSTADGHTGIAFDYKITGVDFMKIEVVSKIDNSDYGIVWYRRLPQTPDWQTVFIPFDSLQLPKWGSVDPTNPAYKLELDKLRMLQWAAVDVPGKQGTIAIDNVYFVGGTKVTPVSIGVVYFGNAAKAYLGASASLINRNLFVSLPSLQENHAGTVSLVNIKGVTVAAKALNPAAGRKVALDVSKVSNGMYFCVVKTSDAAGTAFNTAIPVTLF